MLLFAVPVQAQTGRCPNGQAVIGLNAKGAPTCATVSGGTGGVTGLIDVTATPYNADNTCATDAQSAIQSALTAARTANATVYFPPGCYLTSALTYLNQNMAFAGTNNVTIKGQPLQDIFQIPDPSQTSNSATVGGAKWTGGVTLLVNDSQDASATFPRRLPGRYLQGCQMTSGQPTLDCSVNLQGWAFQGEVTAGAAISVVGAGSASCAPRPGTNCLNTTVLSMTPFAGNAGSAADNSLGYVITLNANATASPTNTTAYIALPFSGQTITTSVGNCAISNALYDGNRADWPANNHAFFGSAQLEDVTIDTTTNSKANASCGVFIQGGDYGSIWTNPAIRDVQWGYVEAWPTINQNGQPLANDFLLWFNPAFSFNAYPFIAGTDNGWNIHGWQIYGGDHGIVVRAACSDNNCARSSGSRWNVFGIFEEPTSLPSGIYDWWATGGTDNRIWSYMFEDSKGLLEIDSDLMTIKGGQVPDNDVGGLVVTGNQNLISMQSNFPQGVLGGGPWVDSGFSNTIEITNTLSTAYRQGPSIQQVTNGVLFAGLGTVVNGAAYYCNNCDPAVNPPVACTSTSASAIAEVGTATTHSQASGTSIVINKPTGTTTTHVLVAWIWDQPSTTTVTTPAGWNALDTKTETGNNRYSSFYRLSDGTDGSSYTFNFSTTATFSSGAISTWSGASQVSPIDAHTLASSGSGTSAVAASLTAASNLEMLIAGFVDPSRAITTPGVPSGMAQIWHTNDTVNGDDNWGDNQLLSASGPTGTKSSSGLTNTDGWGAMSVLIRPATQTGAWARGSGGQWICGS